MLSRRLHRRLPDFIAVAGLAFLALAFFWRPLLSRGVWVPMGGGDMASFIYPMFAFAARSLASGTLPLWNPSVHAGMPFAADWQSGLFYPLNWPFLLRGAAFSYRDLELAVLLHYPLAGAFTYALSRELGSSRIAAFLSGAVFMLSGFMVTHLGHANMVQSAIWIAPVLLFASRALRTPGYGYAALAGGCLALALLAGHPQMVMLQAASLCAFASLSPIPSRAWLSSLPRRVGILAVAALAALGLAALKILPGAELTRASLRADLSFDHATEFATQPIGLVNLVLPHIWGTNPTDYWGPWSNTEVLGYVGILPLILALLALLLRREFAARFFVGLAAAGLLLSLGDATALFGWAYRFVPGFDMVRAAGRYLLLFDIGVALAAGFGLDALRAIAERSQQAPLDARVVVGWVTRGVGVAFVAVAAFAIPVFIAQQAAAPVLLPRVVLAIQDLFMLAVFLLASLFLLVALLRDRVSGKALSICAVLVAGLDVASAYHAFNPTQLDPIAGFRHSTITSLLETEGEHSRVDSETGVLGVWQPDSANVAGFQDAGGLFNPLQLAPYAAYRASVGRAYGSAGYDLLGVSYLIAGDNFEALQPDAARARLSLMVRDDSGVRLYQYSGGFARARVVYAAESVGSADEALARLSDLAFDPRRVALVQGPALLSDQPREPTDASILEYTANAVAVHATAGDAGYLVLADPAYSGWRANVDGASAPVYTAYGVFRAVPIGAGDHVVRFEFAPLTWQVGWRLSALTLVLLTGWLGWNLALAGPVRRRMGRPNAASGPPARVPELEPAGRPEPG